MKRNQEEKLLEEELEISTATGTAGPISVPSKFLDIFPAFAHRNFRLYFAGQSVSLIGFWLHQVAVGWLAFQLTNSAFWVGTTMAIGGLPFLIFTTFAGVLVDKVDKKKILLITMSLEAIVAFFVAIAVFQQFMTLPILLISVFIFGMLESLDLPARLTYIVEMVGKKDLASAIPINNGIFNAARFIGPATAGLIIASFGIGWPFVLNGISYLAGIWAILNIKPIEKSEIDHNTHPWESLKEGIAYSFSHPKIFHFMILAFFTAIFIWPFQTLMPLIAEKVFSSGAQGYGSLLSSAGLGSLAGAIYTSANSKSENKIKFVKTGIVIAGLGLIIFSLNRNFIAAHAVLFVVGFGTLTMVSTLNTLVQLNSPDHMRARVMSVYLTMFIGMLPLGSELAGIVSEKTSEIFALGLNGALFLTVGAYFYLRGNFTKIAQKD